MIYSGSFSSYVKFQVTAQVVNTNTPIDLFIPVRVSVPNLFSSAGVSFSVGLDFDIGSLRQPLLVRVKLFFLLQAVFCY